MSWVLFQEDDVTFKTNETWERLEDALADYNIGSDPEECPHRADPAFGFAVHKIMTVNDEVCCYIRDNEISKHAPAPGAPNRWIANE